MKAERELFVSQVSETHLKVVKFQGARDARRITGLASNAIPPNSDEKGIREKLYGILKQMKFSHSPLIISLTRAKATSRYLKVPTQIPEEIESIITPHAPP